LFKRFLQSHWVQAVAARGLSAYVNLVARTTRWRIEGTDEMAALVAGPPVIVVFWHETLPSMPVFWRRARAMGLTRPAFVLASGHRDGRLIGRAVEYMGISVVAGSSSRGGAAGLRGLVAALKGGGLVGLTPDGPRGPRRVAAPGVAQLAALTGAPVLPCAARIGPAKTLASWDGMRIPLPFGRGRLVCGPMISVPRDGWEAGLKVIETGLNEAMRRAGA
jgi:lysophospholipid acyltransferase (LPLAT)-like uncharacterized protein